ncbi:22774_t:CDS:2, partial [Gigaspora margarita]
KTHIIEDVAHTDVATKKLRKDIRMEIEELKQFIEPLKNHWGLEVVEVVKQDYSTQVTSQEDEKAGSNQ